MINVIHVCDKGTYYRVEVNQVYDPCMIDFHMTANMS